MYKDRIQISSRLNILECANDLACICVCIEFSFHWGHPYCLRLCLLMCLRFAEDNAQTKVNLYFTSEVCNCLDQFSAPMVLQTLSDEKFNDSFQFQTEKRKISRRRSRTSDYAGIANVTFLFCRRQQNNVQIFFYGTCTACTLPSSPWFG